MRIFIIGGSGFIGRALIDCLKSEGHELTALMRPQSTMSNERDKTIGHVSGNPMEPGQWQNAMIEHDVVINLAGSTIFRRWSDDIKKEIIKSRITTTRNVVEAIKKSRKQNIQIFNASGVGYYGYREDETLDEDAPPGDTFLAKLAVEWEAEARRAEESGTRVVLCRFGIVLGKDGGALGKISALVRRYLGGVWGSGEQWFSWMHEKDLVDAFLFLLKNQSVSGAVNFSSPEPVRNREMIDIFRKVLKKSAVINAIPQGLFTLIMGEFANVFLNGQRAIPRKLLDNGFVYRYPVLEKALVNLLPS